MSDTVPFRIELSQFKDENFYAVNGYSVSFWNEVRW